MWDICIWIQQLDMRSMLGDITIVRQGSQGGGIENRYKNGSFTISLGV